LEIRTEIEPNESAAMVDETGFGFYYQPSFNPGIDALAERRDMMGVRTFVNTVETLANPSGADIHLGSFYHLPYAKRIIDTFETSERYDVPRVVMFQGMEGYDDIRPGSTTVAVGENGDLDDFTIETPEYGMDFDEEDLEVEDVAADSATITEGVLAGERDGAFADAIALNGAFRIYAREDCDSLDDGLAMARKAIADGSAEAVLDELRAF